MTDHRSKSKTSTSSAEQELDKAQEQFEAFDQNIKSLTLDRMNEAPKLELESSVKLSQNEIEKSKDIYLKPFKTIACREKFNEKYREKYNFSKEYVHFTAINHEIIGEEIDLWTKPYAGIHAEEWKVPANTPVWGPRYLAEQIKGCTYHRLKMQQTTTGGDHNGQYYGSMAVDTKVQRLDAIPVSSRKSIFMGAGSF